MPNYIHLFNPEKDESKCKGSSDRSEAPESPPLHEEERIASEIQSLSLDDALQLNKVGFYHYRLLFLCGFAWMADALEISLLTFLSACAGAEWHLTETQQAAISGAAFAGVILGSGICGVIADWYGRKIGFLSAGLLVSIGGLLTSIAPNYPILLLSRVLVGFGIGGGNIPFDLLAELLPTEERGSFLVYVEYFWTFGSAFVSLLAWLLLDRYGWRYLALITIIPVAITTFLSMYYLPESPRWLLLQHRESEAETIIKDSMVCNGYTDFPLFTIKPIHERDAPTTHSHHSSESYQEPATIATASDRMEEQSNHNLLPDPLHHHSHASLLSLLIAIVKEPVTIPLWIVWFSMGATYYGFILFITRLYSNEDSPSVPNSSESSSAEVCRFDYSNIFVNALAEFVGVTLCIYVLEYFGRIKVQLLFYGLAGIATFMIGCSLQKNWIFLLVAVIGRMSVMISADVTWVMTPELYPTSHRTMAHAICVAASKVGALLSPFLVVSSLSVFEVGVILAVVNGFAVMACLQLPETEHLSLGELDAREEELTVHGHLLETANPIVASIVDSGGRPASKEDTERIQP